jgi:uncharacterized protein (TIGR02466 family)
MATIEEEYKLFPTLVWNVDCSELLPEVAEIIKKTPWMEQNPGVSEGFQVLKQYKKLTEKFEKLINFVLDDIKYCVSMKMTTSWFTNTEPGRRVEEHNHNNSFWSAVFYLHDASPLILLKGNTGIEVPFTTTKLDLRMHGGVPINAKKGHMIIFPSSVRHASDFNNTPYSRYSLAMNFMPSSQVFQFDSSYHYGSDSFNSSDMNTSRKEKLSKYTLDKGFG